MNRETHTFGEKEKVSSECLRYTLHIQADLNKRFRRLCRTRTSSREGFLREACCQAALTCLLFIYPPVLGSSELLHQHVCIPACAFPHPLIEPLLPSPVHPSLCLRSFLTRVLTGVCSVSPAGLFRVPLNKRGNLWALHVYVCPALTHASRSFAGLLNLVRCNWMCWEGRKKQAGRAEEDTQMTTGDRTHTFTSTAISRSYIQTWLQIVFTLYKSIPLKLWAPLE